jgi:hypothetical protein
MRNRSLISPEARRPPVASHCRDGTRRTLKIKTENPLFLWGRNGLHGWKTLNEKFRFMTNIDNMSSHFLRIFPSKNCARTTSPEFNYPAVDCVKKSSHITAGQHGILIACDKRGMSNQLQGGLPLMSFAIANESFNKWRISSSVHFFISFNGISQQNHVYATRKHNNQRERKIIAKLNKSPLLSY